MPFSSTQRSVQACADNHKCVVRWMKMKLPQKNEVSEPARHLAGHRQPTSSLALSGIAPFSDCQIYILRKNRKETLTAGTMDKFTQCLIASRMLRQRLTVMGAKVSTFSPYFESQVGQSQYQAL